MSTPSQLDHLPPRARKKALKIISKIEVLTKRINEIAGAGGSTKISVSSKKGDSRRGKRSAAVRAKMAAAAKARWARIPGKQ
jgi:hypothetical protein